MKTMKLTTILIASSLLAASAFGVTPARSVTKKTGSAVITSPLRKDSASVSPLFRDTAVTRGGAVPGWAAYNDALDKHPLTAKAFTSLVGWALGDVLAQVCSNYVPSRHDPMMLPRLLSFREYESKFW